MGTKILTKIYLPILVTRLPIGNLGALQPYFGQKIFDDQIIGQLP